MEPPITAPIPDGEFLMGCDQGRDEEKPVHRVWVDAFEMAVHQVRNRDYACFLESTRHPAPPQWNDSNLNDPDQPVVSVSWFDAVAYCAWLTEIYGRRYRLPTEAEWERAARGGREGELFVWGAEPQSHPNYARRWTGVVNGPRPVGEEPPNPYGLFDLGENVHEWCSDWYGKDYYAISPDRNPQGPETGDRRASRGGSWRHHIKVTRCAARSSIPPAFHYADYGFRVVSG
jgi:formylglycine-generating enzyme required for sulfatase activity